MQRAHALHRRRKLHVIHRHRIVGAEIAAILRELQPGEAYVSTLQRVNDRDTNPLWRVQIPLPPVLGWEHVPMPDAIAHHEGNGLSLWTRYMQPGQLAKIHAQTLMTLREETEERERQAAALSRDARLQLVENPGLVEVED